MAKRRQIRFPFPVRGIDQHWAHRKQPLESAPDLLNVRAYDALGDRHSGGSRPCVRKAMVESFGDEPIRCIAELTTTREAYVHRIRDIDDFRRPTVRAFRERERGAGPVTRLQRLEAEPPPHDVELGEGWSVPLNATYGHIIKDWAAQADDEDVLTGNVRHAVQFTQDATYSFGGNIGTVGRNPNGKLYLWARMDPLEPDPTVSGVEAVVTVNRISSRWAELSGSLNVYHQGQLINEHPLTFVENPVHHESWPIQFGLSVRGNEVAVRWGGYIVSKPNPLHSGFIPVVAHPGTAIGFGTHREDGRNFAWREWAAFGPVLRQRAAPPSTRLFVGAGNSLYIENDEGEFELCEDDAADLPGEYPVMATQYEQSLVFAVHDAPVVEEADGIVGGTGKEELTSESVEDWTDLGIDPERHVVVLSDPEEDGPLAGSYRIASVQEGKLILDSSAGNSGETSFAVVRAPIIYEPGFGVRLFHSEGAGDVPTECQIVTTWSGRLVWARNRVDAHNWWMSRQGEARDYDYTETDEQAAVAGNASDSGKVFDVITAVMPFTDDYLLFGCVGSVWRMSGDPAQGGRIDPLSYESGVLDAFAWCSDPQGAIYFLGPDGVNMVAAGQGIPQNLTVGRVPDAFRNVDPEAVSIIMAWDHVQHGVFVFLTPWASADATHWFYDARADGWFRDMLPMEHGPTAVFRRLMQAGRPQSLLLGGRDGYVREYDRDASTDDGEPLQSYIKYAPQRLLSDGVDGLLVNVSGDMRSDSGPVRLSVVTAPTHEDASAGRGRRKQWIWQRGGPQTPTSCRLRGSSVSLRITNGTSARWAVEHLWGEVQPAGRRRL